MSINFFKWSRLASNQLKLWSLFWLKQTKRPWCGLASWSWLVSHVLMLFHSVSVYVYNEIFSGNLNQQLQIAQSWHLWKKTKTLAMNHFLLWPLNHSSAKNVWNSQLTWLSALQPGRAAHWMVLLQHRAICGRVRHDVDYTFSRQNHLFFYVPSCWWVNLRCNCWYVYSCLLMRGVTLTVNSPLKHFSTTRWQQQFHNAEATK